MAWIEGRILQLEAKLENLYRRLQDLVAQLNAVRQTVRAAFQQVGSGGGGSSTVYLSCTLSSALAHGSSVAGQTVWQLASGSRSNVTTTGTIYNDGPASTNDIASGAQVIVLPNPDGSYTAIGVYC